MPKAPTTQDGWQAVDYSGKDPAYSTHRLKVPGGWLYRVVRVERGEFSVVPDWTRMTVVFVPGAAAK
jgi:hypothetical protein